MRPSSFTIKENITFTTVSIVHSTSGQIMGIFKCLSRNASLVQEKEEKSLRQKLKLIFKQNKRRSNAIDKKKLTPKNAKRRASVRFTLPKGENALSWSYVPYTSPTNRQLQRTYTGPKTGSRIGINSIQSIHRSISTAVGIEDTINSLDCYISTHEIRFHCKETITSLYTEHYSIPTSRSNYSGMDSYFDDSQQHVSNSCATTASANFNSIADSTEADSYSTAFVYDTTSQESTGIANFLDGPWHTVKSSDGNSQTSEALSPSLLVKHESINRLMSIELDYIDCMHYGMERYSRPLRHCILSGYQHLSIFQNIEKLVTISEYHVKQMEDNSSLNTEQSSERDMFVHSPSLVYESKIHVLCQAYESYAQGLHKSNLLLHEMNKNKTFSKFIKGSSCGSIGHLSVTDFINKPVMHIHELHKTMKEILTTTPPYNPDFPNLKQIVEKLSRCVRIMTEPSFAEKVPDLVTIVSSKNSQTTRREKDNLTSSKEVGSGVQVKSVDGDVVRIQERLVFSSRLQDLYFCLSERHLIYQGNIHKRFKRGSWFKFQLLLFTDLLLMASERHDGSLYVSDCPISIQDLAGIEINRKHPSEFVLLLHPTSPWRQQQTSSSWSATKVLLRALSPQEKFVWRTLLGQRVLSVTGDTLLYLSPA